MSSERASMAQLVEAMRPWLPQVVFVGGWAHRLHRDCDTAHAPPYEAIRTLDVDIALSRNERLQGDVAEALRQARFHEELTGEHVPPVSRFRLDSDATGFSAEFLAPLLGSGRKRDGTPDATERIAGVTAQKLRHLDVLMHFPVEVYLTDSSALPVSSPVTLRLAHPVTFIAQKILIQSLRPPGKRAQDALYIHDTIDLFAGALDQLRADWREHIGPHLHSATATRIIEGAATYARESSDVTRTASRIPQDRTISEAVFRRLIGRGLMEIFD